MPIAEDTLADRLAQWLSHIPADARVLILRAGIVTPETTPMNVLELPLEHPESWAGAVADLCQAAADGYGKTMRLTLQVGLLKKSAQKNGEPEFVSRAQLPMRLSPSEEVQSKSNSKNQGDIVPVLLEHIGRMVDSGHVHAEEIGKHYRSAFDSQQRRIAQLEVEINEQRKIAKDNEMVASIATSAAEQLAAAAGRPADDQKNNGLTEKFAEFAAQYGVEKLFAFAKDFAKDAMAGEGGAPTGDAAPSEETESPSGGANETGSDECAA